ncbi:hypothetical protein [Streptomyces sp. NPDC048338]|uniref:hypothetical protein n=1 Tax=Streptomyces sp. NPDC048338 TaxID=3365536 RepID=UPI003720F51F
MREKTVRRLRATLFVTLGLCGAAALAACGSDSPDPGDGPSPSETVSGPSQESSPPAYTPPPGASTPAGRRSSGGGEPSVPPLPSGPPKSPGGNGRPTSAPSFTKPAENRTPPDGSVNPAPDGT